MGVGCSSTAAIDVPPLQDVRDEFGKWLAATVTPADSKANRVHVHFKDWDAKWDVTLNYQVNRHMFAPHKRYTAAAADTTKYRKGDIVEVKCLKPKPKAEHQEKWLKGKVTLIDGAQVQVKYYHPEYDKHYQYWYHVKRNEMRFLERPRKASEPNSAIVQRDANPERDYGETNREYGDTRFGMSSSRRDKFREPKPEKQRTAQTRQEDDDLMDEHHERDLHKGRVGMDSTRGGGSGRTKNTEGDEGKLCCDRCNGNHLTEHCPIYRKPRPKHKDAWVNKGKKPARMGSSGGNVTTRSASVVRQPGDGNCLFHSLAYGLGTTNARNLRSQICRFIYNNPKLDIGGNTIEEWVDYDRGCGVGRYANHMNSNGIWGGGIEIAACAHMNRVNVYVWERTWSGSHKRISCFEVKGARKVVNVVYQGRMHYDALIVR
mmetsp:Transcript_9294/g.22862  ORF Transcript_9294/g.22862 Transcript_9294/m.22862 type:complete len:431 (-) Transcript_9294:60-1352(-)